MNIIQLDPSRGSKLWKSGINRLLVHFDDLPRYDKHDWSQIWMVLNDQFLPIQKISPDINFHGEIYIPSQTPFMFVNLLERPISFQINGLLSDDSLQILFDPYRYEQETHENLDPETVKLNYLDLRTDYLDILTKWYSVKFTFSDYNIIFLRPGAGISFQSHQLRSENWEILKGNPIVIVDNHVYYNINPDQIIQIDYKMLHSILNPSNTDWVVLKETYSGQFDENDITRIYNPNQYFSK